jgi:hypothetical protein
MPGTTLRLTKGAVARVVIILLLPSLPIYTTPIKHLTKASTMPPPRQPCAPLPAPHIRLELRLRPCQPHTTTVCTRPCHTTLLHAPSPHHPLACSLAPPHSCTRPRDSPSSSAPSMHVAHNLARPLPSPNPSPRRHPIQINFQTRLWCRRGTMRLSMEGEIHVHGMCVPFHIWQPWHAPHTRAASLPHAPRSRPHQPRPSMHTSHNLARPLPSHSPDPSPRRRSIRITFQTRLWCRHDTMRLSMEGKIRVHGMCVPFHIWRPWHAPHPLPRLNRMLLIGWTEARPPTHAHSPLIRRCSVQLVRCVLQNIR